MPRRVQDIVPNDRRSIRDISVKKTAKERVKKPEPFEDVPIHRVHSKTPAKATREDASNKDDDAIEVAMPSLKLAKPATQPRKRKKVHSAFIFIIVGIVIVVSGAAFVTSTRLARATFTLIPQTKSVSVDRTYTFSATQSTVGASYQLVTLTDTATTSVQATTGAAIQTKAHGMVNIYNTFSAQSQRLVAGSRLSDDAGQIYRLTGSVVVPGYKTVNGSNLPGMVTAAIIADQAGQQYDITRDGSVSDFKFVAYNGSPKYTAIYARLATEITGGFLGAKKIVAPTLVASTTDILKAKLTSSLLERIKKSVPADYVMYPAGYAVTFGAPTISGGSAYTANLSLQGTVYGVLFKRSDLISTLIGAQTVQSFSPYGYDEKGLDDLTMSVINNKDFSPIKKNILVAGFKGPISLTGIVPTEELKKKLAGISIDKMQSILKPYDAVVESGSGELTPPWAHVPTDISRITIIIDQK